VGVKSRGRRKWMKYETCRWIDKDIIKDDGRTHEM
jgi:hypothetical protein